MDDLKAHAVHLRSLGELPPSPERRAEVADALHHKREGIQSVAAQVLGRWGGRESLDVIRAWLMECFGRKNGWSVRGVAVEQLVTLVEPCDAGWVLELYLAPRDWPTMRELLPLVEALPPDAVRAGLVARLRDPEWLNRMAAVTAIAVIGFPDARQLIAPLIDDPHRDVRKSVARFMATKL